MNTKICTKCNEEKPLTEFHKNKNAFLGVGSSCKVCRKQYAKEYAIKNKTKIKKKQKKYREINKDKIKRKRQENKEYSIKYRREYYLKNRDSILEKQKIYAEKNKIKIQERQKKYQKENKDKFRQYKQKYYKNNIDKCKKAVSKYQSSEKGKKQRNEQVKNRRKNDPLFKLKKNIRTRIWSVFKKHKTKDTEELLGCTFKVAKSHIESTFTEGMSWENYGEWHVDHIIPLASAETEDELVKLCHYTNLQALWAEDNWKKNDKM